jgi:transposase
MRRWLVERFFAWMQWQRRILVRWEYDTQNFLCSTRLPRYPLQATLKSGNQ